MTHSEAIEKPVARARAGIASDSAARMPGAMIASDAEMTQLRATATTMFGAQREADRRDRGVARATVDRKPDQPGACRRRSGGWRCGRRTRGRRAGTARRSRRRRRGPARRGRTPARRAARRATTNPMRDDGEERQRPPDPAQRRDLVDDAPALGERRRRLLGVDDLVAGAGGAALPATADRLVQPQREHGERSRSG